MGWYSLRPAADSDWGATPEFVRISTTAVDLRTLNSQLFRGMVLDRN